MDPRWKHPFPALVAGPTCCGKGQFVKRLLESGEDMIDDAPDKIIWCYGMSGQSFSKTNVSRSCQIHARSFWGCNKKTLRMLICDLKPETPTDSRLRTDIFSRGDSVRLRQKRIKSLNHIKFLQLWMAQRLRKNHDLLKLLVKCTPAQRKAILEVADEALITTICECVLNVLKGTVPVSKPAKKKLLPHKKSLIALAEKCTPLKKKKKLLVQHGGNFLSVLLPPVLRVLS